MKKTKISVDVHKSASSLLMTIIDFIGQHNEGKISVTPEFIEALCLIKKAETPTLYKDVQFVRDEIKGCPAILVSMEKEFNPFITIRWKEVYELNQTAVEIAEDILLNETEKDLLTQQKLS